MATGIYLLAITPEFTKIGRSGNLDKRLDYWRSHGIQVGLKLETTVPESYLMEWGLLRINSRPSEQQITAFMRREPLFPLNRLSRPQGSTEWVTSDMIRMRTQVEILLPTVQEVAKNLTGAGQYEISRARNQLKPVIPRADGLVDC